MAGATTGAVAVLMAVWRGDRADFFDQAMRSLLAQQFANGALRIYLAIDGPLPANLAAVVAQHRAACHRVLVSPQNRGLAASLNTLLAVLEPDTDLLLRHDADDISLPGRAAAVVAHLRANPRVQAVGSAVQLINHAGTVLGTRVLPTDWPSIKHALACTNPIAHPSVCLRRSFITRLGGWPQSFPEDLALWQRAALADLPIENLREPLLAYRLGRIAGRRDGWRAWSEFRLYARHARRVGRPWCIAHSAVRLAVRLAPPTIAQAVFEWGSRRHG